MGVKYIIGRYRSGLVSYFGLGRSQNTDYALSSGGGGGGGGGGARLPVVAVLVVAGIEIIDSVREC